MKFNEKLQNLRKEKGLSQEKLAEMLGVSRQAISKWEGAQAYPEMEKLIVLSEIFGITLDSFVKEGALKAALEDGADGASGAGGADSDALRRARFWDTYGGVYEYKSKRTLCGLPLVHVHVGRGMKRAKGIIAVGNVAQGVVAVGLIALGGVSLGLLSLGAFALGTLAVGLIGVGAVSVGALAVGALAFGIVTCGAVSVGMFSTGALAVASHVAVGDHAYSNCIAAGRVAEGIRTFVDTSGGNGLIRVDPALVRQAIYDEFPWVWRSVVNFVTALLAA